MAIIESFFPGTFICKCSFLFSFLLTNQWSIFISTAKQSAKSTTSLAEEIVQSVEDTPKDRKNLFDVVQNFHFSSCNVNANDYCFSHFWEDS